MKEWHWYVAASLALIIGAATLAAFMAPTLQRSPMDRRQRLFRECIAQTTPNNLTECAVFVDRLIPVGETE